MPESPIDRWRLGIRPPTPPPPHKEKEDDAAFTARLSMMERKSTENINTIVLFLNSRSQRYHTDEDRLWCYRELSLAFLQLGRIKDARLWDGLATPVDLPSTQ